MSSSRTLANLWKTARLTRDLPSRPARPAVSEEEEKHEKRRTWWHFVCSQQPVLHKLSVHLEFLGALPVGVMHNIGTVFWT